MVDGYSVVAVVESQSSVNTSLQCLNMNTNDTTIEQSIFASLDVTSSPTYGAKDIHTMCLEAGVTYTASFTFLNFGSSTAMNTFLLDSVRMVSFSF